MVKRKDNLSTKLWKGREKIDKEIQKELEKEKRSNDFNLHWRNYINDVWFLHGAKYLKKNEKKLNKHIKDLAERYNVKKGYNLKVLQEFLKYLKEAENKIRKDSKNNIMIGVSRSKQKNKTKKEISNLKRKIAKKFNPRKAVIENIRNRKNKVKAEINNLKGKIKRLEKKNV